MPNFYISISNGLLKDGHQKRIGAAVWEFMWCIDKVTRIDEDGTGWVLGGRPIKLEEIAAGYHNKAGEYQEGLGLHEKTVAKNLHKLEDAGYINRTRTPYGVVISVVKTKKRFNKNAPFTGVNNSPSHKKRWSDNTPPPGDGIRVEPRRWQSAPAGRLVSPRPSAAE